MKKKLLNIYNNFFGYKNTDAHEFILPEKQKINNDKPISILDKNKNVFSNSGVNLDYIKSLYNILTQYYIPKFIFLIHILFSLY